MGILSWFRRSPEPDFSTVLSTLSTRIQTIEQHLRLISLRERRANALFITYGLTAWVLWSVLWWFEIVGKNLNGEGGKWNRTIWGIPVVAGPILIIFTRRILRAYYTSRKNRENNQLKKLKKERGDKLEELKKKTGYYSTKELLDKYDEKVAGRAIQQQQQPVGAQPAPGSAKKGPPPPFPAHLKPGFTSPSPSPSNPSNPSAPSTPTRPTHSPSLSLPGSPLPPQYSLPPPPPPPRTIFDKLADALLGENADGDKGKYALICGGCWMHNGLVREEERDTVQYKCPHCGHFNPAKKNPQSQPLTSSLSAPTNHLRPTTPNGDLRRRVQSMHLPNTTTTTDEDEEDEGEVMKEKKEGRKGLRERRTPKKGGEEEMDVDE